MSNDYNPDNPKKKKNSDSSSSNSEGEQKGDETNIKKIANDFSNNGFPYVSILQDGY